VMLICCGSLESSEILSVITPNVTTACVSGIADLIFDTVRRKFGNAGRLHH
jgi:hypothetical protein